MEAVIDYPYLSLFPESLLAKHQRSPRKEWQVFLLPTYIMATLSDIKNKIYALTGTDSTSYPASQMLIDLNFWHQKIVGMILESQDESDFDDERYGDYPQITAFLTANRDYPLGQTITNLDGLTYGVLKVKDVTISYDGVNWYRATPFDITENDLANAPQGATTQEATIDSFFPKTAPRYDYKNNSIWIYPRATAADIAAGGKIMMAFYRTPVDFTSSELSTGTVQPGISQTFHAMYAYGPSFEYTQSKQLPQKAEIYRELQVYEDRLKKQYSTKNADRKYALKPAYVNYK